jgi:hypothetical protein
MDVERAKGVRRVLYRLPELLEANPSQPAFVCEGEKDVDNVRAIGLTATCNSGGAGWRRWRFRFPMLSAPPSRPVSTECFCPRL